EGKNEEEVWHLFDYLIDAVEPGEEIVLDVTHSYRSLPILVVIAGAYLRVVKEVRVERILYGAYEARDDTNHAPVFDLSPSLSLLEWTAATDLFQRTGNAEPLAALLRDTQDELYRSGATAPDLPKRLKSAAGALASLSEAMRLVRVHESMQLAGGLLERLAE